MSDHDALLAAICENPDEDTPRLVFADWLDENDRCEQAAFVRAQVELARTPAWEPFAVLCKWRRSDWLSGKPFRHTLPAVDGFHIEWHPEAFSRGFGWRLNVRSLVAWEQQETQLLNRAPVGEMHLWGATLDDWRRFAASPVVRQLRRLRFVSSPIEPLRVLRENPQALGITELFFDRASGAGMPEVVEDLVASPLGRLLRGLHFHMGYESLDLLVPSLASAINLRRLSFSTMGLTPPLIRTLVATATPRFLNELHLHCEYALGNEGIRDLAAELPSELRDLTLSNVGVQAEGIEAVARAEQFINLRRLNLSQNTLSPRATKLLAGSRSLSGLRSLVLNKCRLGDKGVRHLTKAKFWPNLVELDLASPGCTSAPGPDCPYSRCRTPWVDGQERVTKAVR
jgi:uncharacterized protein (TIGR02996 family)